jgi:hypothetical protein
VALGFEGAPWYGELVARAFGDQEIVPPGITLSDPVEPDWWIHKRKWQWSSRQALTAQVAIGNGVAIVNLAGSKFIIVVTKIIQRATSTIQRVNFPTNLPLPANYIAPIVGTVFPHDGRYPAQNLPVAVATKSAGGITGITTSNWMLDAPAAGACVETPDEWHTVLEPAGALIVECDAVNTVQDLQFLGYIRQVRAEELAE